MPIQLGLINFHAEFFIPQLMQLALMRDIIARLSEVEEETLNLLTWFSQVNAAEGLAGPHAILTQNKVNDGPHIG